MLCNNAESAESPKLTFDATYSCQKEDHFNVEEANACYRTAISTLTDHGVTANVMVVQTSVIIEFNRLHYNVCIFKYENAMKI